MAKRIYYQKQLLKAIDGFLEGTPLSCAQAHKIIRRCYRAIHHQTETVTLNQIIWGPFVTRLTDSVYYENEEFLRDARERLLGQASQSSTKVVFHDDYRSYFTANDAEWYAQLLDMMKFIMELPFAEIHKAAQQALQNKVSWEVMRTTIPEGIQAYQMEEEYQQKKSLIEARSGKNQASENVGDEKIYHLILREVTDVLTNIQISKGAIYFGYPILQAPYSLYGSLSSHHLDITEELAWVQRSLEALIGKRPLFISWRLSKASTFDADVLFISLH